MNQFENKLLWLLMAFWLFLPISAQAKPEHVHHGSDVPVGLFRLFETEITNSTIYKNPFTEVRLEVQYQSPSGKLTDFYGFYDGDGKGGAQGTVWKIRFMPDEVGQWKYVYRWSDGAQGGKGSFVCTADQAGKGILKPYGQNPHWLAYNGTEPVWLKSYYETGHGSIGQDFDWVRDNVYQPLIDHGYNHLQVNWLLSLCCFGQYYLDGPEPETLDLALYEEGDPFGTMNLEIWHRMEKHLGWLNQQDVGVHMFLGVDGSQNEGPDWSKLSSEQKDAFVNYMVARLAPFANLAGWNFVWEVPGDREDQELGFARLVAKYDVFDHLRTYEDEFPRNNEYHRNEYSFAAIENHEVASADRDKDRLLWKDAWTHHMACLLGYEGKPVFMSEGNALWRRFWHERVGATQEDLLRAAWACATAGASFTWNGHAKEYELFANGPSGLPFSDENPFHLSEKYITILSSIMKEELGFYSMKPHDELLSAHQATRVFAMAEPGKQYLVFTMDGAPFSLSLEEGEYPVVTWIDSKSEKKVTEESITGTDKPMHFQAPSKDTDWVLVLKSKSKN
ncbi:hypothetical protein GCM10028791_14920 [Echinicola sediminis]